MSFKYRLIAFWKSNNRKIYLCHGSKLKLFFTFCLNETPNIQLLLRIVPNFYIFSDTPQKYVSDKNVNGVELVYLLSNRKTDMPLQKTVTLYRRDNHLPWECRSF